MDVYEKWRSERYSIGCKVWEARCPNCHYLVELTEPISSNYRFCPYCGFDMKSEKDNPEILQRSNSILTKKKITRILKLWLNELLETGEYISECGGLSCGIWTTTYTIKNKQKSNSEDYSLRIGLSYSKEESDLPTPYTISVRDNDNVLLTISEGNISVNNSALLYNLSAGSVKELINMLNNPEDAIKDYYSRHPKFSYSDKMVYFSYKIEPHKSIEILFMDMDKPIPNNGSLFVGFDVVENDTEKNYLFEIIYKKRNLLGNPNSMCSYRAKFCGHYTPSEHSLQNAKLGWVVDEQLIKNAIKESGYL